MEHRIKEALGARQGAKLRLCDLGGRSKMRIYLPNAILSVRGDVIINTYKLLTEIQSAVLPKLRYFEN